MSSFARVAVEFLTAARVSQQPHQATAQRAACRRSKKKSSPWRAGAERRGDCLSRMVWARRGAPRRQGEAARERAFRGNRFSARELPVQELLCKENWGDRKPEGRELASGVARRDARKGRQSPAFGCGRLPGDSETSGFSVVAVRSERDAGLRLPIRSVRRDARLIQPREDWRIQGRFMQFQNQH